ncbi:MAG: uracil-DNA glycosylase [Candidatus Aminicenantes bacterium]|nr:uracil-DNA glycosylase [Candidatus Aminicenantes bacterium]
MKEKIDHIIEEIEKNLEFLQELGIDSIAKPDYNASGNSSQKQALISLEKEIKDCRECPLAQSRTKAVPGEGDIHTDLMFVGEGPGSEEDKQGRPFVGRAGKLLTRIIKAMTFDRRDVYITNVVKCRPPENRNPRNEEIQTCEKYLLKQIELISPKVIVTLGNVPTKYFLKESRGITALRGQFSSFHEIRIMPTFHPSYLVRNQGDKSLKKMVWQDMQKVMAVLGKK